MEWCYSHWKKKKGNDNHVWLVGFLSYCKLNNMLAGSSKTHSTASASSIMLSTLVLLGQNIQSSWLTVPYITTIHHWRMHTAIMTHFIQQNTQNADLWERKKKEVGIEAEQKVRQNVYNSLIHASIEHSLVLNILKLYLKLRLYLNTEEYNNFYCSVALKIISF